MTRRVFIHPEDGRICTAGKFRGWFCRETGTPYVIRCDREHPEPETEEGAAR